MEVIGTMEEMKQEWNRATAVHDALDEMSYALPAGTERVRVPIRTVRVAMELLEHYREVLEKMKVCMPD